MPRVVRSEVVRRLRAIRAELGLSDAELARRLGVGRTTYLNWETENPSKPVFPSEEAMAELCDVLPGLTLDYIYLGKLHSLRTDLAVRLTAREQGLDPLSPDFRADQVGAAVAARVAPS